MKLRVAFLALCVGLLCSLQAFAQQHYTEGGVTRVVLLAVTPGKLDPFLGDLSEHLTPIWQEEKQQGLIADYQVELNTTKDSPEDWDVAIVLHYKNMAALDGLAGKVDALTIKHYGSIDTRQKATDNRVQLAHVVGSRLMRDITLK